MVNYSPTVLNSLLSGAQAFLEQCLATQAHCAAQIACSRILASNSWAITHQGATATCRKDGDVLSIDYAGAISDRSMRQIDLDVSADRLYASVVYERIDSALTMFSDTLYHDKAAFPDWTPPSAVIVREDQYAYALAFCQMLEKSGILRTCWLPGQALLARSWMAQF